MKQKPDQTTGLNGTVVHKESYDSGEWIAMTMGEFISILVDAGHDPAVAFRVTKDHPIDPKTGLFVREIELVVIPQGHILKEITRLQVDRIHKTLVNLLNGKVLK